MEQREFIVEQEGAGTRIDRFLSGEDTGLSRSALQGLMAQGHVLCNGRPVPKSQKLKAGDTLLVEIPDAKPIEAVPQNIPLDIVYEDEHLLVVNKPKGWWSTLPQAIRMVHWSTPCCGIARAAFPVLAG